MTITSQSIPMAWLLTGASLVGFVWVITILLALYAFTRARRLERRLDRWLKLTGIKNLEELLEYHGQSLNGAAERLMALEDSIEQINKRLKTAIRGVETVRFDAFDATGNGLSFAIALLTEENNGVVLTGIHGREESRVYAKPIEGGQSSFLLAKEEKEALFRAKQAVDANPSG